MRLNELRDNKGARYKAKRVGRGIGSGKGKTSARGGKGQTARSGVAINGFEGGQMPIHRRLPKRGFVNPFREEAQVVNLDSIIKQIQNGKISGKAVITKEIMKNAGLIKSTRKAVKLLARGECSVAVNLEVDSISASAREKIEKQGGSVTVNSAAKE